MKKFALPGTILGGIFISMLQIGAAQAQATRTWVSGVGDDANPCSRTAPCKTFAGAISKTAAGGEINCIDPGGFGGVTITKSMTIDCLNTEAGVLVAGTNGIIINAAATDIVVLRGLDIFGTATPSLNGVRFIAGASLSIEKSVVREFTGAGPNGNGISFEPSGASKLYVTDTTITSVGNGASGAGVQIKPSGTGSAKASLNKVSINGTTIGVGADGTATTGSSFIHVVDSVISGAGSTGVLVNTGGGVVILALDRSTVSFSTTGISSAGANSHVVVGGSTIFENTTGLATSGGGTLTTYQNNVGKGLNPTDGLFTGTQAPY